MALMQRFDRDKTFAIFENPQNGYQEAVPELAWLWTLLFGAFYLAYRQVWLHVALIFGILIALSIVLGPAVALAAVILHLVYAKNAKMILVASYYRRGWRYLKLSEADTY